jgi:hypothetical protein
MKTMTAFFAIGALAWITAAHGPIAHAQDKKGAPAPAVGDVYVYRVVNKYNQDVRGELRFQIDKADANGTTVSVTPSGSDAGAARTHVYARDGNWLRHPLDSHGKPVEYVFATPFPAYACPLEADKKWSTRVKGTPADYNRARSVRVDGKVLRRERVRVPAGEFDAWVIRRTVYAGDSEMSLMETRITETEWYAPALRRTVRLERNSTWRDTSLCGRGANCDMRGDWSLIELIDTRAASR